MRSISRSVAKLNTFDVKNLLYHKEVARNFAKRPEVIEKQHEFMQRKFEPPFTTCNIKIFIMYYQ